MKFDYKLNKSKKAKRISIKIDHDNQVILTIPYRISKKQGEIFLNDKKSWILKHLSENQTNKLDFITGTKIPYLGSKLKLLIRQKDIANAKAKILDNYYIVFIQNPLDKLSIRRAIIKHFKEVFRKLVSKQVEIYSKLVGVSYNRISIKDNKTNWGSCSSKHNLNFTWRLIFSPIEIITYVVVHEVCHLKHQNHSQAFWLLVETYIPDYKKHRLWLKNNSHMLNI